jgi:NADPH:quinone reductase-like Zn-dependent oxidoreductase
MKAIQYTEYGSADVLQMVDVPSPDVAAGQVKIDVRALSINPLDWKIRAGAMGSFFDVDFPAGVGRDGAGVIADFGEGVSGIEIGDQVSFVAPRGEGCSAEQIAIPAEMTAPKADHLSFAEAAAYPLVAVTAWVTLEERYAGDIAGKDVLIHGGAGGVGGMAIQIARHKGARVSATCSAANADYVKSLGAETVVAYDVDDFSQALSDIDVVFDTMGGEVHRRSYEVLKKGGRLVCINAAPIEDLSSRYGVTMAVADVSDIAGGLSKVAKLVGDKILVPQVNQTFPFARIADAHRAVETGRARGKIVVILD